jgi:hypothetical protein
MKSMNKGPLNDIPRLIFMKYHRKHLVFKVSTASLMTNREQSDGAFLYDRDLTPRRNASYKEENNARGNQQYFIKCTL